MEITTIGLDLAKNVYQVHAITEDIGKALTESPFRCLTRAMASTRGENDLKGFRAFHYVRWPLPELAYGRDVVSRHAREFFE